MRVAAFRALMIAATIFVFVFVTMFILTGRLMVMGTTTAALRLLFHHIIIRIDSGITIADAIRSIHRFHFLIQSKWHHKNIFEMRKKTNKITEHFSTKIQLFSKH